MSLLFRLPDDIRAFLKKPYGPLFKGCGPEVVSAMARNLPEMSSVICVGDVTTFNIFSAGLRPRICIIDDFTKRVPVFKSVESLSAEHSSCPYSKLTVKNPAGFISDILVYAVGHAVSSSFFTKIVVDGEEDLASLPAIAFAPTGSVVLYGQPDQGMVFVEVTEAAKKETFDILTKILNPVNIASNTQTDASADNTVSLRQSLDLKNVTDFCNLFK